MEALFKLALIGNLSKDCLLSDACCKLEVCLFFLFFFAFLDSFRVHRLQKSKDTRQYKFANDSRLVRSELKLNSLIYIIEERFTTQWELLEVNEINE